MGQVQSGFAVPCDSPASSSLNSLMAEAIECGSKDDESHDAKAEKALECPCLSNLRGGPCGAQFSDAFLCFLKSTAEEKGSDCATVFVALQNCFKAHPNIPSELVEATTVEDPVQEYKIIPPVWSRETSRQKSKL